MPLFALTLSPGLRHGLLITVETTFIVFVVVSFVVVAAYTARQVSTRRLLAAENAPPSLLLKPLASGWQYIGCVMAFIYIQSLDPQSVLAQLAFLLFPFLVIVGVSVAAVQNHRTVAMQFGFDRLPLIRAQAISLLIFGAVMLVESPLSAGSDWFLNLLGLPHPDQDSVESFRMLNNPATIFLFILQAAVVSPIVEEFFFRGFLLSFLKNYTSPTLAIVLSAGVFASAHLNLGAFLPLWFLGIVLGAAYEHTGTLLVPMTIHGCFNLATALSMLLERGNSS